MAANEDHEAVGEPHGEGKEDLGVGEEGGTVGLFGEGRPDEEAGGHAGKAEEEGPKGDLVGGIEGREPGEGG